MAARERKQRNRVVKIPVSYLEALENASSIFPSLYQLENGLRIVLHEFLSTCYGMDWWEKSLKNKLPEIYQYAETQNTKKNKVPWLGNSNKVKLLPIHLTTLGQLEEIVKKYKSDCIPELFPSLEFFLGHMEIIKRVRNFYSHMFPCITKADCTAAQKEVFILSRPLNERLKFLQE